MSRRPPYPAAAVALIVVFAVVALSSCVPGDGVGETSEGARPPTLTTTATTSAGSDTEAAFLDQTADHVCEVQGRVYDDAQALEEAFGTQPTYRDLTATQIEDLRERLVEDVGFASRLNDRIDEVCGDRR